MATALTSVTVWAMIFVPAPAAFADAGGYLAITNYQQNQSNWCWATAAEVVIKYEKGTTVSQCTLVNAAMGTKTCGNVQANDAQVKALLLKYLSAATISNGNLAYATLAGNIDVNRPILAHIVWATGGGHMVTINAYENGYNNGQAASTIVDYSNSDGAVGNGTNATVSSRTLSSFWKNASFSQYSSLIGIH